MEERELLESLRTHLVRERIVAPNQGGPVRYEALKTLARKWNLHKEPGFWRQYNKVDKLARVLATEAQSRRRYAFSTSAAKETDSNSAAPAKSRRIQLPAGASIAEQEHMGTSNSGDVGQVLQPYRGDLFGTKSDYSSSLVYLSRRHRDDPAFGGTHSSRSGDKLSAYRDAGRTPNAASARPGMATQPSLLSDTADHAEAGALDAFLSDMRPASPGFLGDHAGNPSAQSVPNVRDSQGALQPAPPSGPNRDSTASMSTWASGSQAAGRPTSRAARLAAAAEEDEGEDSSLLGTSVLDILSAVGGLKSGDPSHLSARRMANHQRESKSPSDSYRSPGGSDAGDDAGEDRKSSLRQQCALALRDMSMRKPAARRAIVAEGAMPALLRVLHESPAGTTSRLTCIVALANLSALTSGDPRYSFFQERIPPPPHVPKRKGGAHARRVAAAAASVAGEAPSSSELAEVSGVVAALADVGKGLSLNLGDDAEMKIMILTSLFNFSCHRAYRKVLIASGGVKALLDLLQPVMKTHVKAGLVKPTVPEDLAELLGAESSDADSPQVRSTVQGARLGLVDAWCLTLGIKALCNISGCWQGSEALLNNGALEVIAASWDWLTHEQRCSLGAHVLYNLTRSRSYMRRATEEGVVLLLRSVIHACADAHAGVQGTDTPVSLLNTFTLRRTALALARMAAAPSAETYLAHCGAAAALSRVALIQLDEHLPLEQLHVKPQVGVPLTPQSASEMARRGTMLHVSAARGRLGKSGAADGRPPSGAAQQAQDAALASAVSHPGVPQSAPDAAAAPPSVVFDMEYGAGVALVTSSKVVGLLQNSHAQARAGSPQAHTGSSPNSRSIVPADRGLSLLSATLVRRKVAMALARLTWQTPRAAHIISQHNVARALAALAQSSDGPTRKVALTAIVNAFKAPEGASSLLEGGVVASLTQLAQAMEAEDEAGAALLPERPLLTQAMFNMSCHRELRETVMSMTTDDVTSFAPANGGAAAYEFAASGQSDADADSGSDLLAVFKCNLTLAVNAQRRLAETHAARSREDVAAARSAAIAAAEAARSTAHGADAYANEGEGKEDGKASDAAASSSRPRGLKVSIGGAATFGGGIAGARDPNDPSMSPTSMRHRLASQDAALKQDINTVNKKQWVLVDGTEAPETAPEPAVVLSFALATLRNLSTGEGWERHVLACPQLLALLRSLLQPGSPRFALLSAAAPVPLTKPPVLAGAGRGGAASQTVAAMREPDKALAVPVTMSLEGNSVPHVDLAAFNMSGTSEEKEGDEEQQPAAPAPATPRVGSAAVGVLAYPTCQAPLACLADAIGVIANLSLTSSQARDSMVHEGLLALLIPIATSPLRSMLTVAYAQSVFDVHSIVGGRLAAASRMADMAIRNVQVAASELKGPSVNVNNIQVDLATALAPTEDGSDLGSPEGGAPSLASPVPGGPSGPSMSLKEKQAAAKAAAAPKRALPPATHGAALQSQVAEHSEAQVELLGRTATVLRNQCAIALSAMATDTADSARLVGLGVMEALVALCTFTRDGDPIRQRVTAALRILSEDMSVSTRMVYNAHAVPVAVDLCGSSMSGVRQEAVGLLYNLSRVENAEDEMVEAGVVPALLVIALIKNSDAPTQATCMETLHNLMASPMVRLAVLHQGVIWALQKLSLSADVRTQRACAITLYRLAHDGDAQALLVREGGLRSVISVLTQGSDADPAARAAGRAGGTLRDGSSDPAASDSTLMHANGGMLEMLMAMQGMDAATRAGLEVDSQWKPHALLFSNQLHSSGNDTSAAGQRLLPVPVGAEIPEILRVTGPSSDDLVVQGALLPGMGNRTGASLGGADPSVISSNTDPVVGAFFAGVLAAVSREKGSEARLVAEGAVEALVLLATRAVASEEDDEEDAYAEQAEDRERSATQLAADGAVKDRRSLLLSCAAGLYNISCAPSEALKRRVVAGGAPAVFVRLAASDEHAIPVRRQSAAGLINLLWGSVGKGSMSRAVVKAGAVRAFTALAADGVYGDAFACTTALHYLSLMPNTAGNLVEEGAVEGCVALAARTARTLRHDTTGGTGVDVSKALDVAQAALTTLTNLCASARGACREKLLCLDLTEEAVNSGIVVPKTLSPGAAPLIATLVAAGNEFVSFAHRLAASPQVAEYAPLRFTVHPLLSAAAESVGLTLPGADGRVNVALSNLEACMMALDGILAVLVRAALPTPDDDMVGLTEDGVAMDVAQYAVSSASDSAHSLVLSGVLSLLRDVLNLPAEQVPPATVARATLALRALSIHDVLHAATAELEADAFKSRGSKASMLSPLVTLVQRLTYRLGGLADDEEYSLAATAAALGAAAPVPKGNAALEGKVAEADEGEEESSDSDSDEDYGQAEEGADISMPAERQVSAASGGSAGAAGQGDDNEQLAGALDGNDSGDDADSAVDASEGKSAGKPAAAQMSSSSAGTASVRDQQGDTERTDDAESAKVMSDAARAVTVWDAWVAGETLSHAARVLCSMATHQVTRPSLILAGAAPALIAVSDMPGVDPRLRHACLRGLCELAIARDDSVDAGTGKDITAQALAASAAQEPELRAQLSSMVRKQVDPELGSAVLAAGRAGSHAVSAGPSQDRPNRQESAGVAAAVASAGEGGTGDVVESGAVSALVAVMGGGRQGDSDLMGEALDAEEHQLVEVAAGVPRPLNALVKAVPVASLGAREMHRPLGVPSSKLPSVFALSMSADSSSDAEEYYTLGRWLGVPLPDLPQLTGAQPAGDAPVGGERGNTPQPRVQAPAAPAREVTKATVPAPPAGSLVLGAETRVGYLPHPTTIVRLSQWLEEVMGEALEEEAAAAKGGRTATAEDDEQDAVGLADAGFEVDVPAPVLYGACGFMRYPGFYVPDAIVAHVNHMKEAAKRGTTSGRNSSMDSGFMANHAFEEEAAAIGAASKAPLGYGVRPSDLDALLCVVPQLVLQMLAPPDPHHTATVDISVINASSSHGQLPSAGDSVAGSPGGGASDAGSISGESGVRQRTASITQADMDLTGFTTENATKKRKAARRASTGYKLNNIFASNSDARGRADFDISAYGVSHGPTWPKVSPEDIGVDVKRDPLMLVSAGGDRSPAGLMSGGAAAFGARPSTANSIATMAGAAHAPVSARRGKRHRSAAYLSSAIAAVLLRTAVEDGREVSYHRGRAAAVAVALGSSPEAVAEEQRSGRSLHDFTSRIVGSAGGDSAYAMGSNTAAAAAQAIALDVVPDGVGLDDTDYVSSRRLEQTDDDFSAWVDGWGRKIFGASLDDGDEAMETNTSAEENRLAELARLDAELHSRGSSSSRRSVDNASSWFGSSANMAAGVSGAGNGTPSASNSGRGGPASAADLNVNSLSVGGAGSSVSERPVHVWPGSLKWEVAFIVPAEPEAARRIALPNCTNAEALEALNGTLPSSALRAVALHARRRVEAAVALVEDERLAQSSSGYLVHASEVTGAHTEKYDQVSGQIPPLEAAPAGMSPEAALPALLTSTLGHVLTAAVMAVPGLTFTEVEANALHRAAIGGEQGSPGRRHAASKLGDSVGSAGPEHPSGQEVGGGVALEDAFGSGVRSGEPLQARKVATPPAGSRGVPGPRTKLVAQRAPGAQYSTASAQAEGSSTPSSGTRKPSRKVKRAGPTAPSAPPAVAAETVSSAMRRLEGRAQRSSV